MHELLVGRPSGRRLSLHAAKPVGLKPDPQVLMLCRAEARPTGGARAHGLPVGRPSGRRFFFDAAKPVGLKPDPQVLMLCRAEARPTGGRRCMSSLWVGLQADAFPCMQRNPSG